MKAESILKVLETKFDFEQMLKIAIVVFAVSFLVGIGVGIYAYQSGWRINTNVLDDVWEIELPGKPDTSGIIQ